MIEIKPSEIRRKRTAGWLMSGYFILIALFVISQLLFADYRTFRDWDLVAARVSPHGANALYLLLGIGLCTIMLWAARYMHQHRCDIE